jgi:hypothetical protein
LGSTWEILVGVAGLWALGALLAAANALSLVGRSQPAPGVIVDVERYTNDCSRPVVEFVHRGVTYRIRGRFGTSAREMRVGAQAIVRIRDGRPEIVRIGPLGHVLAAPIALAIAAIVFGAMAGCVAAFDAYG